MLIGIIATLALCAVSVYQTWDLYWSAPNYELRYAHPWVITALVLLLLVISGVYTEVTERPTSTMFGWMVFQGLIYLAVSITTSLYADHRRAYGYTRSQSSPPNG